MKNSWAQNINQTMFYEIESRCAHARELRPGPLRFVRK